MCVCALHFLPTWPLLSFAPPKERSKEKKGGAMAPPPQKGFTLLSRSSIQNGDAGFLPINCYYLAVQSYLASHFYVA